MYMKLIQVWVCENVHYICRSAAGLGCHILAQLQIPASRGQRFPPRCKPAQLNHAWRWASMARGWNWAGSPLRGWFFFFEADYVVCVQQGFLFPGWRSRAGGSRERCNWCRSLLKAGLIGSALSACGFQDVACVFFLNPSAHFRACCRCSSCARGLPGFLLHAPRAPCSCTPSGEGAAVELSAVGAVWCSMLMDVCSLVLLWGWSHAWQWNLLLLGVWKVALLRLCLCVYGSEGRVHAGLALCLAGCPGNTLWHTPQIIIESIFFFFPSKLPWPKQIGWRIRASWDWYNIQHTKLWLQQQLMQRNEYFTVPCSYP